MRAQAVILLLILAVVLGWPAEAKDRPLGAEWSGVWADPSGQHRCALQIWSASRPTRVTLLCQLGPDGVYGDASPIPAFGVPIVVTASRADFGTPPAGHFAWGAIRLFAACNNDLPEIIGTAEAPFAVAELRLFPVALSAAGNPCDVRAGGDR